jgi:hypothetical protein
LTALVAGVAVGIAAEWWTNPTCEELVRMYMGTEPGIGSTMKCTDTMAGDHVRD